MNAPVGSDTPVAELPAEQKIEDGQKSQAEERPPQQEELLCTICGMRSCWR